ncbi:MAG: hypothetical protein WCQ26_10265 [Pseudanabaena sp. ELA748]
MAQNPLVEQAKQGNVNAIASLMNRLLKSQAMLANVEGDGDHLEILIESDLRSLDDEMRIPKREILVGMLKKWFITLEVQNVSRLTVSWQQTGFDEPAWTEEIYLHGLESPNTLDVNENGGITEPAPQRRIPPLPSFLPPPMLQKNDSSDRANITPTPVASDADLDEMFGEATETTFANTSSSSEPDLLLLSDVPPVNASVELQNSQTEAIGNNGDSLLSGLLKTPKFAIQFAQYIAICLLIIVGLRGLHAALGGSISKAPKSAAIPTEITKEIPKN